MNKIGSAVQKSEEFSKLRNLSKLFIFEVSVVSVKTRKNSFLNLSSPINPLVPEFSKTSEIVKTYINIHTTYGIQ